MAQAGLGQSYLLKYNNTKQKQWIDSARQACERAVSLDAKLAAGHICLGSLYNFTGEYEKAVPEFQTAAEREPTSDDAYRGLASAYEQSGQFQAAEQTYEKAIKLRPSYWGNYNRLGRFYLGRGSYQKAVPMFQRVTELTPDNRWGYTNLGVAYYYLDRLDEAAAMYRRTLEIRPDAMAYSNLGTMTFFTGRYAESVGPFEKAVELEPQNYLCWGNLADAYRWTPGKQDRAKATYARAIGLAERELEVNPRDAIAIGSLAMFEAKSGDLEKARSLIAQALAIAPNDVDVLSPAVEVYTLAGEQQKALDCLKNAVQGGYPRFELEANPELANLRNDPRYRAIMAEAKTPRSDPIRRLLGQISGAPEIWLRIRYRWTIETAFPRAQREHPRFEEVNTSNATGDLTQPNAFVSGLSHSGRATAFSETTHSARFTSSWESASHADVSCPNRFFSAQVRTCSPSNSPDHALPDRVNDLQSWALSRARTLRAILGTPA